MWGPCADHTTQLGGHVDKQSVVWTGSRHTVSNLPTAALCHRSLRAPPTETHACCIRPSVPCALSTPPPPAPNRSKLQDCTASAGSGVSQKDWCQNFTEPTRNSSSNVALNMHFPHGTTAMHVLSRRGPDTAEAMPRMPRPTPLPPTRCWWGFWDGVGSTVLPTHATAIAQTTALPLCGPERD